MRLNFYQFPDDTADEVLIKNGCPQRVLEFDESKNAFVEVAKRNTICGVESVKDVRRLIKEFGGRGWSDIYGKGGKLERVEITK